MAMAQRLAISTGGQISVPAVVRKRWGTRTVVVEDRGDHVVVRPAPDDPVAAAVGAFVDEIAGLGSDDARRMDREEELEVEERE